MARYIDADALLNALKEERKNGNFVFTSKWIKEIMDNLPTADVVPKSEADDLKRYIILNEDIAIKCKRENGEQNEEYWKGKISAFRQIRAYIDAELKKKYTESESVLGEYKFDEKIHTGPLDLSDAKFIDKDGNVTTPADWQDWNETPPWEESEDKE